MRPVGQYLPRKKYIHVVQVMDEKLLIFSDIFGIVVTHTNILLHT